MASALKRKRGPVEVLNTPKRAKSAKESQNISSTPKLTEGGWDAAFNALPKKNELIQTNGINGESRDSQETSGSPESVDFETFVEENRQETEEDKRKIRQERRLLRRVLTSNNSHLWRLSEPIGGRQISVDPVFTSDEKYAC
jgi:NET1-associated nuclear protein 1 (U3 small nucleolar RNA-associated protein 17)